MTHILHRRLALLLSMVTVALMAGCASAYAPSKEALKQLKLDEGYADFEYAHLAKVWPEDKMNLRQSCEKLKAEGKPVLKACDNPDDYVAVQITIVAAGGTSIVGTRPLLIKKSFNAEPGMIIKMNMRYGPDEGVLDVRKPTDDCKWVGFSETGRMIEAMTFGGTMGALAVSPIVLVPYPMISKYLHRNEEGGIVCDGWDYREAYKTWLATYRDL